MILSDPVEGVDYIFDREAYLGLPENASAAQIRQALRIKRAGLHPDKLVGADAEVLRKADELRARTDACAQILLNDDLRPLYRERLQWFKENRPKVISKDGTAIIDMGSERLSVEFLLRDEKLSLSDVIKQIEIMTRHSPALLDLTKRAYDENPHNDAARTMYKGALESKWTYLDLLEDYAWAQAGVAKFTPKHGGVLTEQDGYVPRINREIETRHADITAAINARHDVARIGVAPPLLLLSYDEGSGEQATPRPITADDIEKLAAKAQATFTDRAAWIRELATEKQKVLDAIIPLTTIEDLGIPAKLNEPYYLHLMLQLGDDEQPVAKTTMHVKIVGETSTVSGHEGKEFNGLTIAGLRSLGLPGCAITHNTEIGQPLLEFRHAASEYMDRMQPKLPEATPTAPTTGLQKPPTAKGQGLGAEA